VRSGKDQTLCSLRLHARCENRTPVVHGVLEVAHCFLDRFALLLELDHLALRLVDQRTQLLDVAALRVVEVHDLLDLAERETNLAAQHDQLETRNVTTRVKTSIAFTLRSDEAVVFVETK